MNGQVAVENLNKRFFSDSGPLEVLSQINININGGEFISLVGHSGCGKSTLLRILAGLETEYEGVARLDGQPILKPSLEKGFVFQDHRLFPWLTVAENIGYGLPKGRDKAARVAELVELVGLTGFEKHRPSQLSGGMAQRAAIARALGTSPKVLLLDEPFGALDAMTRITMQEEILKIWEKERVTVVLVTHDIDEAVYLSNEVLVIAGRPGQIVSRVEVSLGRPRDRLSSDFNHIKRKIYRYFFTEGEPPFAFSI